jgi:ribonuclease PH
LRRDSRAPDELRPVRLETGYLDHAEGSCLVSFGATRVLCAASVENRVPPFLVGTGRGWVTAEYALLPRSTHTRTPRETGRPRARTQEIKRFIGRALRAVCDLERLGERQVVVDCDVLQADGGTRTAALTGGFVALALAVERMLARGYIAASPVIEPVAAVSVGRVGDDLLVDLCYEEDSRAELDMNLALTAGGRIVEIQATAEGMPFTFDELVRLHGMAAQAIGRLVELQRQALART